MAKRRRLADRLRGFRGWEAVGDDLFFLRRLRAVRASARTLKSMLGSSRRCCVPWECEDRGVLSTEIESWRAKGGLVRGEVE